jgi:methylated-DNA-[protein]-cysteine S-methyltransferase
VKSIFFYHTEIGEISITENGQYITEVYFGKKIIPPDTVLHETELLKDAAAQLDEYLAGKRQSFTLPFAPEGTEFQRSVWNALLTIPYGETRSYKQIAQSIGKEKACRAVGNANNKNPVPILIPCHRVIGANSAMVGYYGGLEMKKHLLDIEKAR